MEIERKIVKHPLSFEKALSYFIEHLQAGNTLSQKVLENVTFKDGAFFTLLPTIANTKRLLLFSYGGIVEPAALEDSKKIIPMDIEFSALIYKYLCEKNLNKAIFENVLLKPSDPYAKINNISMLPYGSDVYYILSKKNTEKEVYSILRKSSHSWHSLCILTRSIDDNLTSFEENTLMEISKGTELIITSAYDGEGYIFWERS